MDGCSLNNSNDNHHSNNSGNDSRNSYDDCPSARSAAKSAVKETFAILGVNVDDPAAVEEFRKSLRFGDSLRRASDKGFIAFVLAVTGFLVAVLFAGLKIKLGA